MPPFLLPLLVAGRLADAPPWPRPVRASASPTDGTPGNNNSVLPAMSATGRFVAFMSFASNLVPGDTNGVEDVFLRDRDTDADGVFDEPGAVSTVRVSQRGGVQANGASNEPAITADGRYVVFTSFASNLFAHRPAAAARLGDPALGSAHRRHRAGQPDARPASRSWRCAPSIRTCPTTATRSSSCTAAACRRSRMRGFRGVIYRRDIAAGTLTPGQQRCRLAERRRSRGSSTRRPRSRAMARRSPTASSTRCRRTIRSAARPSSRRRRHQRRPRSHARACSRGCRATAPSSAFIDAPGRARAGRWSASISPAASVVAPGLVGISFAERVRCRHRVATSQSRTSWSTSATGRSCSRRCRTTGRLRRCGHDDGLRRDSPDAGAATSSSRTLATLLDGDGDGLNDHWETVFGLDPPSATGGQRCRRRSGQRRPDQRRGVRPRLAPRRHARRASWPRAPPAPSSRPAIAIANPTDVQANVALRLELDGGGSVRRTVWIAPGRTRRRSTRGR